MTKLTIIREGKRPIDRRAPLDPSQAQALMQQHPKLTVRVQSSGIRCFADSEYEEKEVSIIGDVRDSDVLMGIKEVPVEDLVPGKTYLFFSHTIKKQPYNRHLLQEVLNKNIRLIDYECLTDAEGKRLVAFGRWAGIVGAYNALWAWGQRFNAYDLRRAYQCFDYTDLQAEYSKIKLPAIKIALTGGGRVASGAVEVLDAAGIRRVSPEDYLSQEFDEPVYTQLNSRHYHFRRSDGQFDAREFYAYPERYDADFAPYYRQTDLLIAAAYWHPEAPVLFTPEDMLQADFRTRIIADVTCDIDGSIPCTKRPSTISEPLYDYDPESGSIKTPLSDERHVTIMAIDNLPCELPRDASSEFGQLLMEHVIPALAGGELSEVLERATIASCGKLRPAYAYLQDYIEGLE